MGELAVKRPAARRCGCGKNKYRCRTEMETRWMSFTSASVVVYRYSFTGMEFWATVIANIQFSVHSKFQANLPTVKSSRITVTKHLEGSFPVYISIGQQYYSITS